MAITIKHDTWTDAMIISMNKAARWETTDDLHAFINVSPQILGMYREPLHSVLEAGKPVIREFCVNGGVVGGHAWFWATPFRDLNIQEPLRGICENEKVVTIIADKAARTGFNPPADYVHHFQRYLHFAASDWISHVTIDYTRIILPKPVHHLNDRYSLMSFELSHFGHALAEKFRQIQTETFHEYGIVEPSHIISGSTFVQAVVWEVLETNK